MKPQAQQKNLDLAKKQRILGAIIACLLIISVGWWAWSSISPKPLGDGLIYLGKKDFGGGLFYSDYNAYSVYYYGTDMTVEEVVGYFKGATLTHPTDKEPSELLVQLTNKATQSQFVISYYPERSDEIEFASNKKAFVSVPSFHYEYALKSLNE